MKRVFAFAILSAILSSCASIMPAKKPSYCQSDFAKTGYNMYETQSDSAKVDVENAKIIGEKILPDNAFESVALNINETGYTPKLYNINITLKPKLSRNLLEYTGNHIGKTTGITANNKLIANSRIQGIFSDFFQITFDDKNEALRTFENLKYINCQN